MADKLTEIVGRLRELLAKATPGPWIADGGDIRHADGPAKWGKPGGKQEAANVALIVEAVNALPDLLAALTRANGSLLREATERAPAGCYCKDVCAAPVIMGRQQPCRRPGGVPGQPAPALGSAS